MELKIKLTCYEKPKTERMVFKWVNGRYKKVLVGGYSRQICTEYSESFGRYAGMVKVLKLPPNETINNGPFRIKDWWVTHLQPYFNFKIDIEEFDCFIDFEYRNFTD